MSHVKATKPGFAHGSRRQVGEVFAAPLLDKDGKPVPAKWYEPVAATVPVGKPPAAKAKTPGFKKVKGEIVPDVDDGISGGGQAKEQGEDATLA